MANKYNAAELAASAHHLEGLARTARANMLSRTTEKATRLGAEGERLSRQANAADTQRAEADKTANEHVAAAARYDAKANALEQQAAAAEARHDPRGAGEARELREDAAKQREGAEVARARAQIATDDAKRLGDEAAALRTREQAIDAELADVGGRLPATELAVDNLEWHAEKARAMADTVRQADDLQAQSRAATARGDHAAAAQLGQRATSLRDDADVLAAVRGHPPFPLDHAALLDVGVDLTPSDLSVPLPELIDPYALMTEPLADASTTGTAGNVAAAATEAGETPVIETATADSLLADASLADTSFADTSFADASFADASVTESSLGVPSPAESFGDAPVESPSFEAPLFAEASTADSSFADSSFAGPDAPLEPPLEPDAGFGDQGLIA
jgi:hypothetical protein